DMYAQTIAYGLFTARVGHCETKTNHQFNRQNAGIYISDKIPFLQGLFTTVISTNIISKINWTIDILIEVLAKVDMVNILQNFGQETRKQDPIVHFYETFLAAYEASLRKSRGVYYTPEPVVSFIVKAVNDILENDFNLDDGLGSKNVTILDPATGTGTFLYEVIKQIYFNFEKYGVNRWNQLFREKQVLKRLYGFELLMTPYTIAHLKLGLLLENLGYEFEGKERLNIFLTNALNEGVKKSELILGQYISAEANQAAAIKTEIPIHVVLGNPPYSGHSENKNEWIEGLVKDYYQIDGLSLDEKNPKWLQDDYVKFIRFGQWRIDKTGVGILAFVTNHGYLDNPTFRGMRQNLLQSFNRIYIVNLHGNAKKKEVSPDGSIDQNVFDIQQGIAILIAVKDIPESQMIFKQQHQPENGIFYYDLWGSRDYKYQLLQELTMKTVEWEKINPISPFYLFTPQDIYALEEYNRGWKITDIMLVNSVGIVTARDALTIQKTPEDVAKIVNDFGFLPTETAREKYDLGKDTRDWQVILAQDDIKKSRVKEKVTDNVIIDHGLIKPILYRPFDIRYTYYTGKSRGFICMPRNDVMKNMILGDNIGLITVRQQSQSGEWSLVGTTQDIIESCAISNKTKEINYLFPLYIYPENETSQERTPNFSSEFITAINEKLGYIPTAENIFYYIYAVFHSPQYRQRYSQFLKIDFPRLPLTSNNELFNQLVIKGEKLVNLHLMKNLPPTPMTKSETSTTANLPLFNGEERGAIHYQGDGKNEITQVKYNTNKQQILINQNCYFSGVSPIVWEFKIGGYQVLDKWLKERKNANIDLSDAEITHYQKIIIVVIETIKLMTEIDDIIPQFPII
ncbi:MAG: type ISP restriction/modification enzyme, partial [Dolichospermum sp.]